MHVGVDFGRYYGIMTRMSNTPNTASKSILARLMADEGITVMHDANAQTASFDLASRTLRLPVWKDMTNALYDMLVGHEVAHALWTPQDRWQADIQSVSDDTGVPYATVQQYANVVEDARIERKIKARFPGIRRDFLAAYVDLMGRDLFDLGGRSIADLALIDRLNLEFKVGLHAGQVIPFDATERVWVDRISKAESWDDVMDIVRYLLDEVSSQDETPEQDDSSEDTETAPGGEGENQSQGGGEATDDESEEDSAGDSPSPEGNDDDGDDESDSGSDDDSDETSEGSEQTAPQQSAPESITDDAFSKVQDHLRSDENSYYNGDMTIARLDLENTIVPFTKVHRDLNGQWSPSDRARIDRETREFIVKSKPVVGILAKQFEMKKSADAHRRTSIHKSGVLDTVKMMNYKWSEDVFRRHAVVREGKNHGLVIFLDWSGSMADQIFETMQQCIQLALFCKKVNIPFEVYAFSSQSPSSFGLSAENQWDKSNGAETGCYHDQFVLLNLMSSKMNRVQMESALLNCAALAKVCSGDYDYRVLRCPRCYGLGSTPLNEAILAALQIVPAFRAETGRQIVSTVFLTDGCGNGMHLPSQGTVRIAGDTMPTLVNGRGATEFLLDELRERCGSKSVNLYLTKWGDAKFVRHAASYFPSNRVEDMYGYSEARPTDAAIKTWKKDNYAIAEKKDGFDEQFLVRVTTVKNNGVEVDDNATLTKKKNAFLKSVGAKMTSRVVLNRFIDIIA